MPLEIADSATAANFRCRYSKYLGSQLTLNRPRLSWASPLARSRRQHRPTCIACRTMVSRRRCFCGVALRVPCTRTSGQHVSSSAARRTLFKTFWVTGMNNEQISNSRRATNYMSIVLTISSKPFGLNRVFLKKTSSYSENFILRGCH